MRNGSVYGEVQQKLRIVKTCLSIESIAQKYQITSKTRKSKTFTSVKKGCMNCYFQVNCLKQKISRGIAEMLTNKIEEDHKQAIIRLPREHQLAITYRDNRIQAKKNQEDELGLAGEHLYYMVRCQKRGFSNMQESAKNSLSKYN